MGAGWKKLRELAGVAVALVALPVTATILIGNELGRMVYTPLRK